MSRSELFSLESGNYAVLVSLIVFLSGIVYAQSQGQAISAQELQAETESLRIQLQSVKDYQASLLATVYWSLGTVVALAVLLVGFGWYSNFRLHEREKAAMLQELENSLDTKRTELEHELKSNLANDIKAESRQVSEGMQSRLDKLSSEINQLKIGRFEQEREQALGKHQHYRALQITAKLVGMESSDYFLASRLDDMLSDVKNVVGANQGDYVFADEISDMQKILKKHKGNHEIVVDAIQKQLRHLRDS